jgi:formate dehydrogenase iron-sulfur subunit
MKGFLIDNSKCIGCRACMVACKQWHDLPASKTKFFAGPGYQNPRDLDANTFTLITYNEVEKGGRMNWVFGNRRCMHCNDPGCASACPVKALEKTPEGPVYWNAWKCIGCRYCMFACPYHIPKFEWRSANPEIRKCTMCYERVQVGMIPSCAKTCPTGAIEFGDRDALVAEAESRLRNNPSAYVHHIYGKDEVGGTCVLILSEAPFDRLGYPMNLPKKSLPSYTAPAMEAIPSVVVGLGLVLGVTYKLIHRRGEVATSEGKGGRA